MKAAGLKAFLLVLFLSLPCLAVQASPQGQSSGRDWMTVAANIDAGYRRTQFFENAHDVGLVLGDTRVEFWLPPFKQRFSWGPYLRLALVDSSSIEPWENAWLSGPGVGLQCFPFSASAFRKKGSVVGRVFGPLRVFAEHNRLNYWGAGNEWRPNSQTRIGIDYWKGINVNSYAHPWWSEIWNGLHWQSSNEFDADYRSTVLGNALRLGVRKPGGGLPSLMSPYGIVESSFSRNETYYWENRLLLGAGLRAAPSLVRTTGDSQRWLTRFVVYVEYLHSAAYYRASAPSSIPSYDIRVGVSTSIGDWYR